ncbi:MAG: Rho termination factor N-terminal domain-containing protein [Desulfarculaceae bacterium]|nr:Rho termination factor N-terminal domain-containing protein [Desulfarculaceae bacterium]MCF8074100.1 Rho termination factor N-terminal domain-containing protein [Desulfarculaceae bacterium]MCF8103777.1 Rho termination factor N-terminal domain-containing protein [Desulfarculaceae bacterium]MCF8116834.1 Rho termination factor N-terminal domain-containing protein [Desulfarculaceae bacterium]
MPTVKQLQEQARKLKMTNYSKLRKNELSLAILLHETARKFKLKDYSKLDQGELIRAIQVAEGNQPCFGRIYDCRQEDCAWLTPCQGR